MPPETLLRTVPQCGTNPMFQKSGQGHCAVGFVAGRWFPLWNSCSQRNWRASKLWFYLSFWFSAREGSKTPFYSAASAVSSQHQGRCQEDSKLVTVGGGLILFPFLHSQLAFLWTPGQLHSLTWAILPHAEERAIGQKRKAFIFSLTPNTQDSKVVETYDPPCSEVLW